MVDLMDPFWVWMAMAVVLAFVFVLMAVRLLAMRKVGLRFFVLMGGVGALLLISILLMVSTISNARAVGSQYAESPLKP